MEWRWLSFSEKEIKHLAIASILVFAVEMSLFVLVVGWNPVIIFLSIAFIVLYLSHEFSHKIVAQTHGLYAEFRLVDEGAILTAISIILPIKFIAPGAVMIGGSSNRVSAGQSALAGPITSLFLGGVLFMAAQVTINWDPFLFGFSIGMCLNFAAKISIDIGFFNMLPVSVLDGKKILNWNETIFYIVFGVFAIAWLFNPWGIVPYIFRSFTL